MDKFLEKFNGSKASFMGVLGSMIIIGYLLMISYLLPQVSILFSNSKLSEEAFERLITFVLTGVFQLAIMVVSYFFGKMKGAEDERNNINHG